SQYTCEGDDFSPPLAWSDVPSDTRSLALIMDDPDSPDPAKPQRVFAHWVVYNISPITRKLPLNAARPILPGKAQHGTTIGGSRPTVARVHPSADIATSSSFMRSTPSF